MSFHSDVAQVEAPKKKVKKTNLPVVELVYGGIASGDLQKAVEKEFEMALQDRVMEETKDKKNAVEAYVYDMRNKVSHSLTKKIIQMHQPCCSSAIASWPILLFVQLNGKYEEFVTEAEKVDFIAKLQDVEDWLYEDGEDETKSVYVAKLEELKKVSIIKNLIISVWLLLFLPLLLTQHYPCVYQQQGDPIEDRFKEFSERGPVINQLEYCINSYREAAVSNDPKFDHIDATEKQKVKSPGM